MGQGYVLVIPRGMLSIGMRHGKAQHYHCKSSSFLNMKEGLLHKEGAPMSPRTNSRTTSFNYLVIYCYFHFGLLARPHRNITTLFSQPSHLT